jgi:uncharacterized protein (DUF2252 family)
MKINNQIKYETSPLSLPKLIQEIKDEDKNRHVQQIIKSCKNAAESERIRKEEERMAFLRAEVQIDPVVVKETSKKIRSKILHPKNMKERIENKQILEKYN